jgi:hypothetical protein
MLIAIAAGFGERAVEVSAAGPAAGDPTAPSFGFAS